MSKTIRVDDDTHAELARLKGDDETFDELITHLLRQRRANIRGDILPVVNDGASPTRGLRPSA